MPRDLPSREFSVRPHSRQPLFSPASPLHSPTDPAANDISLIVSALHNPGGFPREPTVPRERPEKLCSSDSKAIFMLRQAEKVAPVRRSGRSFDPTVRASLSPLKLRPPSSVRTDSLGGSVLPPIPLQVEALIAEDRQEDAQSDSLDASSGIYSDEDSDEVGLGASCVVKRLIKIEKL